MRLPVTLPRDRGLDIFEGFRRDFDELLRDFSVQLPVSWGSTEDGGRLAALDVAETKDAVEITTELPGVPEADVRVAVEGQAIVISGEKKSESEKKDKTWRLVERSYGSFRRVVPLTFTPAADKVHASFERGILHVTVGKPPELVASKVEIPIAKGKPS